MALLRIRILVGFLLFSSLFAAFGQPSELSRRIMNVENNLMSASEFESGLIPGHNIYEKMAYYKIPSVSIAVIHKGKIDWASAYGFADTEIAKPATENTLYQSASASKCIAALCAMKLVEESKLGLYTPISDSWVSAIDSVNAQVNGKKINLLNLLSHTAGFENQTYVCYNPDSPLPSLDDILVGAMSAKNKKVQPILPCGEEFYYSYDGFVIAAHLIQLAGSDQYDSIVRKKLFLPLSMNNSTFQNNSIKENNCATGYFESLTIPNKHSIFPSPLGLWTTPTDLAKMILAIQRSLKKLPGSFLPDTLAQKMLAPIVKGPFNSDAACGFFIDKMGQSVYFSDEGEDSAYKTLLVGGLTSDNGLVVMINKAGQSEFANEILRSVIYTYKWDWASPPTNR